MDKVAKEVVLARSFGFPCCSTWISKSFLSFKLGAPAPHFNLSAKYRYPQNQPSNALYTLRSEVFLTEAWESEFVHRWQMDLISIWGMKVFAIRLKTVFLEADKKFKFNKTMCKFGDFEVNIFRTELSCQQAKLDMNERELTHDYGHSPSHTVIIVVSAFL